MKEKKVKHVRLFDLSEEDTKKLYSGIKKIVRSNRDKAKMINLWQNQKKAWSGN